MIFNRYSIFVTNCPLFVVSILAFTGSAMHTLVVPGMHLVTECNAPRPALHPRQLAAGGGAAQAAPPVRRQTPSLGPEQRGVVRVSFTNRPYSPAPLVTLHYHA